MARDVGGMLFFLMPAQFDDTLQLRHRLRDLVYVPETEVWGSVHRSTVSNWYKRFAAGDTNLEGNERSGRPRTIDDDEVLRAFAANPEATTRELAATLGCSHATIEDLLNRHGYRKKTVKRDPPATDRRPEAAQPTPSIEFKRPEKVTLKVSVAMKTSSSTGAGVPEAYIALEAV
ncbi:hypothetical protein TELCIR_11911 [Teladorsagia circumcincta]|uniref:Mos1 transposase HTH domain-containing protein n=1 Tax=Teladorsagia circumcincta TaxID=45464 RepID=A0A2G9U804_TELCI|nr:hypothetical protein TELCIR_11911 [Teladorsagia circumcincta]